MQPPETAGSTFTNLLAELLDPAWYQARYSDIATANLDPLQHFTRYGAAENRDPNPFFDSAWYIEHYPDVAASGLNPLMHYLQAGAAELRNPHPRFDAAYYTDQHPDAAANPLLFHLRIGLTRFYLTEAPIDIRDYLPSENPPLPLPARVFADVVIPVHHGLDQTQRCLRSVLADRDFPLARIIVIDDRSPEPKLTAWLQELAAHGQIHLLRNRRHLGFIASAALGLAAAESHDVVLLSTDIEVPQGWLRRLTAHAYAKANIATVSPFCDTNDKPGLTTFGETSDQADEVCRTINIGRYDIISSPTYHCLYVRRAALDVLDFVKGQGEDIDFCQRATVAGWQHRLACDTFVHRTDRFASSGTPRSPSPHPDTESAAPFRFALTAGLFRRSNLPVILMITHNLGGGVRRHIDSLVQRYRNTARVLLLQGTDRGGALSILSQPNHPTLTLPSDRLDDLITVLRSMHVSRVHIHHLIRMDMDIRTLIHRLGVPFDVTVHDYFAICPQINLLRWSEGLYCGEPGPAACNACIADQSSFGARDIVSWRRGWAWQFLDADRVICPSADVKTRLDRYGMGRHAIVVPHEQQTKPQWLVRRPKHPRPPLRIVLLGVLANHKGARIVAEVAEAADPGAIEIHLAGHLEARFPKPAASLVKATGKYQEHELAGILQRINPHVFWFPSSAPETYSYTLSTAIAMGLPIVATDLGSFTERLAGRPLTWLVDHRAPAPVWLSAFDDVQKALRSRMDRPPVSRPLATLDFYADQYLSLVPKTIPMPDGLHADRNAAEHGTPVRCRPASTPRGGGRTPKIAVVPEQYNSGGLTPCAYIRLLQPLDHPTISSLFDIILANTETVFDYDVDIIVTQRYAIRNLETANRLADHARRSGAKLLFDLDDDLLNVPNAHPDAPKLRPFAKIVRRMLKIADSVWVSSPALAERLAPIRSDAVVIENRLDERIWAPIPASNPFPDDPVRILCTGTSTHDRDFAMIEPALLRLKAEYGDRIVIDILGMTSRSELPAGLNRIGPSTHASRSYPGFVNWLTSMQPRWHIGLAPLLDTAFNRSKSSIKAMDYAAMGLAVLASDTPVYRGSLADGPAGQLVTNDPRAWHASLDWLIRNQDLRQIAAKRAHEAFQTQATLASHAHTRRAAWADLLSTAKPSACDRVRSR